MADTRDVKPKHYYRWQRGLIVIVTAAFITGSYVKNTYPNNDVPAWIQSSFVAFCLLAAYCWNKANQIR